MISLGLKIEANHIDEVHRLFEEVRQEYKSPLLDFLTGLK